MRLPWNATLPASGRRMAARQCSSVDLPEPLAPMTATISPAMSSKSTPRRASVEPKRLCRSRAVRTMRPGSAAGDRPGDAIGRDRVGRVDEHGHRISRGARTLLAEVVHAGGREVQPAQIGLEMEDGVVGQEGQGQRPAAADGGQLAHALEMGVALGIDDGDDVASGQDGQHDLGEQRGLQVRLGLERPVDPAIELGDAVVGDGVAAPVRPVGALDAIEAHPPARLQAGQCRVDLGEGDRVIGREVAIDQALQVVAVAWFVAEQAEDGVGNAHGPTINCVYSRVKWRPSSRSVTVAPRAVRRHRGWRAYHAPPSAARPPLKETSHG